MSFCHGDLVHELRLFTNKCTKMSVFSGVIAGDRSWTCCRSIAVCHSLMEVINPHCTVVVYVGSGYNVAATHDRDVDSIVYTVAHGVGGVL